jgi:hypothetical protein
MGFVRGAETPSTRATGVMPGRVSTTGCREGAAGGGGGTGSGEPVGSVGSVISVALR